MADIWLVMHYWDEGSDILAAYSAKEYADKHKQYLEEHAGPFHEDYAVESRQIDAGVANLDAGLSVWGIMMRQGAVDTPMDRGPAWPCGTRTFWGDWVEVCLAARDEADAAAKGRDVYSQLMSAGWPNQEKPADDDLPF